MKIIIIIITTMLPRATITCIRSRRIVHLIVCLGIVVSIWLPSAASASAPTDGLVGYWKFDEGSGTTAISSAGNGNTGTLVNGPTWAGGKSGSAINFDGIDDKVQIVSSPKLNNLSTITLSAWIYPRSAGSNGQGGNRIVSKENGAASRRFGFVMEAATRSLGFIAGYTLHNGRWRTPKGSLPYNMWSHVAVTYTFGDISKPPILYINSVPQNLTITNVPDGVPVADDPSLYIGGRGDGKTFDGMIDEVNIYNRALSISEISAVYTSVQSSSNIVVIMSDDQNDVGDMTVMPKTLKLIGSQGLTFTNSFVDFSLCCPSRASFLTGQSSHNTGVIGNAGGYLKFQPIEGNSLPVWLQQAGYVTSHIGKYLSGFGAGNTSSNSPDRIPPGWTFWNGITDSMGGYSYYNYTINENGVMHPYGNTPVDYKTDVLAQKAADFILSRQNSSQPFFLWLAPLAPHSLVPESKNPRGSAASYLPVPAPRHLGIFNSVPLPQRPNLNEADMSDKPGFMRTLPLMESNSLALTTKSFRRRRESLLAVDDMVEKVINALQSSGKLDNTLIVYTSDNGFFHGEHRIPNGKILAYEESIRVPLLIRCPGIPKGQTRNQLVNNLDVVATIEELAKLTPGRAPDGRSLTPLFKNPNAAWRTALLVQGMDVIPKKPHLYGRFQAIRTNNYKYVEHNGSLFGFERELYNLAADPYELESKHNDPTYTGVMADLHGKLNVLKTCAGAKCWMTKLEPHLP